jgi:membrane protein
MLGGGDRIIEFGKSEVFPKLAPSFQKDLSHWMNDFISKDAFQRTKLGLLNVAAILSLFLAAMGMMVAAERNLNRIFRVHKNRSYLKKMRAFWLILSLSPLFIAGSIKVTSFLSPEGGFLDRLMSDHVVLRALYEVLVPAAVGLIGFTIIYSALPNCRVRLRSAMVGGFIAAILWEGSKHLFFIYLEAAKDVTSFYPQVAALPLFLLWLLLNWIIILMGAEIAYVHQDFARLSMLKSASTGGALPIVRCAMAMLSLAQDRFQRGEAVVADSVAHDLQESAGAALAAGRLLAEHGSMVEDAKTPGSFYLAGNLKAHRLEDITTFLLGRLPTQGAFEERMTQTD